MCDKTYTAEELKITEEWFGENVSPFFLVPYEKIVEEIEYYCNGMSDIILGE